MRTIFVAAAACLLLAGCAKDGTLTPQALNTIKVACQTSASLQPVVVAVAPAIDPKLAAAAAVDAALIHPLVMNACAAVNGTPAAVVPSATPVTKPPA